MKLLLDECIDRRLAREFVEYVDYLYQIVEGGVEIVRVVSAYRDLESLFLDE